MFDVSLDYLFLFSVKLVDHPYQKIWKESLFFDKTVKSELTFAYADKKKSDHIFNLAGIALIAVGFLICPMTVPAEMYVLDHIVLAGGMVLARAGAFLCVYMSGIVRAYRLLIIYSSHYFFQLHWIKMAKKPLNVKT